MSIHWSRINNTWIESQITLIIVTIGEQDNWLSIIGVEILLQLYNNLGRVQHLKMILNVGSITIDRSLRDRKGLSKLRILRYIIDTSLSRNKYMNFQVIYVTWVLST